MPCIVRTHISYPSRPLPPASPVVTRSPTASRPWTRDEIESLHILCARGHSYGKIAVMLKRAEGSVYKKATDLGIKKINAYNGPKKAP